mmetsp:Transcript_10437/g.17303  ORF Transcript_10437/g.17303 Transcript_10437/m.17303 type:complete len:669 (+) Transcript_10437:163-2169(+)
MSFSSPDFLNGGEPTMVDMPPPAAAGNDNIAAALSNNNNVEEEGNNNKNNVVGSVDYSGAWNLMGGILKKGNKDNSSSNNSKPKVTSPPSSGNSSSSNNALFFSTLSNHTTAAVSTFTKSITNTVTGRNTLPDKTTASQVLMFRQLLHTSCRPGLRLSRGYEGTAAQKAVLHMPWWERGIERSGKMIISYDNLITRLWISGAILPFDDRPVEEEVENNSKSDSTEGHAAIPPPERKGINTLVNERGLPPIPHTWWVDRLGFQQDDPVTDFRSGGVLSLAMLVHIVESCPDVHARFVPKKPLDSLLQSSQSISDQQKELLTSLEEIIHDDASVLPFGITCINITDMLAKFLLFSKSIDKMDALLSAKPFWKMFLDPNAMLVLQEVSLDLLCDVCVEIGRERRLRNLLANDSLVKDKMNKNAVGMHDRCGKITVFDFTEIMERTEKRVGDEVLGAGPRNVEELRAVARRVKSKYLMRIQLKEKHLEKRSGTGEKQQVNHLNESMKNVVGGVGGFVNRFRGSNVGASAVVAEAPSDADTGSGVVPSTPTEEVNFDGNNDTATSLDSDPFGLSSSPCGCLIDLPADDVNDDVFATVGNSQQQDFLSSNPPPEAEAVTTTSTTATDNSDAVADLSGALSEAFDLLGDGDFTADDLDAMDVKVDGTSAFTIDDL